MDKRIKYKMVLDVETANSTDDALVYDVGFVITDKQGRIYERHSYVNIDIFLYESTLMKSAYYSKKIPLYKQAIKSKEYRALPLKTIRSIIYNKIKEYNITEVYAYNASFDYRALNTTQRYITKSKYRWFLPYGVKVKCIWHMACQVLCSQKSYIKWAINHNKISPKGNIITNAETVYSYLRGKSNFEEKHMGLADTEIEAYIMAYCFRQHKKMKENINRSCWRIPTQKAKENLLLV